MLPIAVHVFSAAAAIAMSTGDQRPGAWRVLRLWVPGKQAQESGWYLPVGDGGLSRRRRARAGEAEGLDPESSIVIHFHKKRAVDRLTGKSINPVAHSGVSGGGIFAWPLGHELSEDWSVPELVGIFHTYDQSKGLMIGTPLWVLAMAVQLGQMKDFGGVR